MDKPAFGKIVENVKNHIRLKLVATAKSKNKSASVPNTIHQNNSRKNCWQFKGKNKRKNKETNESEFVISRSKQESIYEHWYDYVKPKYWHKAKICYKDTDIVHIPY